MQFDSPLEEALLIKRYKRFLADVTLKSGETVVVHVPNSGSMLGVSTPQSPCLISRSSNPERKLPYTLEFVKTESSWVGVNTARTNKLVREAFDKKLIPHWLEFSEIQAEVKINAKSRLDFLLSGEGGRRKRYVEVKNISMSEPPWAMFPDAVTERGQKHLIELMKLIDQGHEAEIFFVVQRTDCTKFKPAEAIDPEYARLLRLAHAHGVLVSCWACDVQKSKIEISHPLEIKLE